MLNFTSNINFAFIVNIHLLLQIIDNVINKNPFDENNIYLSKDINKWNWLTQIKKSSTLFLKINMNEKRKKSYNQSHKNMSFNSNTIFQKCKQFQLDKGLDSF